MDEKKLGLRDVVAVSVGLVIATSSLVSLGQGAGRIGELFIVAMIIACIFNMITMATMAELNALMPNTTGGLAQYTLAGIGPLPTMVLMVGGYFASNILSSGVEASIFAYAMGEVIPLPLPNYFWTLLISVIILIANLRGVDMFAKIQNLVCYLLLGSMLIMGLIGHAEERHCDDGDGLLAVHRSRVCDPDLEGCPECKEKCSAWNVPGARVDLSGPVHHGARFSPLYEVG